MRSLKLALVAFMAVALLSMGLTTSAQDKDKKEAPKYTIKEAMKECMKSDLCKNVASGKGTKADAEKLVTYFTAMQGNKPPKGEEKSWKAKTGALITAAKTFVDGKGDADALKKAANCGGCHGAHK